MSLPRQRFVPPAEEEDRVLKRPPGQVFVNPSEAGGGDDNRDFYDSVVTLPSESKGEDGKKKRKKKKKKKIAGHESAARREIPVKYSLDSLYRAAQEGDERLLHACLASGLDPNALDRFGWSALMMATAAGAAACIRTLLEHGADAGLSRDRAGQTCASLAEERGSVDVRRLISGELWQQVEEEPEEEEEGAAPPKRHRPSRHHRYMDGATAGPSAPVPSPELEPFFCPSCQVTAASKGAHLSSIVHQLRSRDASSAPTQYGIPEANRGFQMLLGGGWDREAGLGACEERRGPKYPVKTVLKRDRSGLGFLPRSEAIARVTHFRPFDAASVRSKSGGGEERRRRAKKSDHKRAKGKGKARAKTAYAEEEPIHVEFRNTF